MFAHFDSAIWILAAVQLAVLAAAMAARHHQGRLRQRFWQSLFLVCLAISGIATFAALAIGPCACIICGAIQAVSVITAVWDLRGAATIAAH